MFRGSLPSIAKSVMYPSFFKMPAMLSFILEWGISTVGSKARLALRIRVSMSEMGSFIRALSFLPTGLGYPRDKAVEGSLAECEAGAAEFAQVAATATAHGTAIHEPDRAGIPRELGQTRIVAFGFQFGANSGVFLDRGGLALVAFNPCSFCHKKF